jgi:hypothetical protein
MGLFQKFLNPNKEYEQLFKDIDAQNIAKSVSSTTTMSIAQFYKFRELLIDAMYKKDNGLLQDRIDCLCDYQSQFGLFWIIGMYKDTYGITLKIEDSYQL